MDDEVVKVHLKNINRQIDEIKETTLTGFDKLTDAQIETNNQVIELTTSMRAHTKNEEEKHSAIHKRIDEVKGTGITGTTGIATVITGVVTSIYHFVKGGPPTP